LLAFLAACNPSIANDSAASTGAGGLQLTREARISMRKEGLFISTEKVRVEYEFVNDTDQTVVTEVAFPIPDFTFEFDDPGGPRSMDDFKVWVEGKEVEYKTEIKTSAKGRDITPLLNRYEVDANSFGHFDWKTNQSSDFAKLPADARQELVRAGAFNADVDSFPAWTVSKTYHWPQAFPSHGILHVVHEYRPIKGFTRIEVHELDPDRRKQEIADEKEKLAANNAKRDASLLDEITWLDHQISEFCVDKNTRDGLVSAVSARQRMPRTKGEGSWGEYVGFLWVDYILTTANSWKTPIQNFELVIEKPEPGSLPGKSFASFCWSRREAG
jgi:hypothetical protein